MTSPEALELEAVDAALAGRYVAPEHAELAELALLLRDDRPEPAPAWATHLDRGVAARFPARPRAPRLRWLRQAVPVAALVAVLVPLVVVPALNGGGSETPVDSGAGGGGGGASSAAEPAIDEAAGGGTVRAQPTPLRADGRRPRAVERAVSITLAAPRREIDTVASRVGDVTAELGGYVARSSISSSQGGTLQLRVPADRLDTAIQRLSKLGKVRELTRDSHDITALVVSARERLNDARAERKSLLRQLANAVTVNETESIRARLRIVSHEIAAARNSLHRARNRADFADVAVALVTARGGANGAGAAWTPGDAFHDALRVLEVIAGVAVIAAAVAVPLLLAWLLGWLARRGVTRRRRERALDMA
jgi:hypothetical protein